MPHKCVHCVLNAINVFSIYIIFCRVGGVSGGGFNGQTGISGSSQTFQTSASGMVGSPGQQTGTDASAQAQEVGASASNTLSPNDATLVSAEQGNNGQIAESSSSGASAAAGLAETNTGTSAYAAASGVDGTLENKSISGMSNQVNTEELRASTSIGSQGVFTINSDFAKGDKGQKIINSGGVKTITVTTSGGRSRPSGQLPLPNSGSNTGHVVRVETTVKVTGMGMTSSITWLWMPDVCRMCIMKRALT